MPGGRSGRRHGLCVGCGSVLGCAVKRQRDRAAADAAGCAPLPPTQPFLLHHSILSFLPCLPLLSSSTHLLLPLPLTHPHSCMLPLQPVLRQPSPQQRRQRQQRETWNCYRQATDRTGNSASNSMCRDSSSWEGSGQGPVMLRQGGGKAVWLVCLHSGMCCLLSRPRLSRESPKQGGALMGADRQTGVSPAAMPVGADADPFHNTQLRGRAAHRCLCTSMPVPAIARKKGRKSAV